MQSIASTLKTYRNNINKFEEDLQSTNIWYLYFSRAGQPKIRTKLRVWDEMECFVAKGSSTGWCYVYLQTVIAYLVTVYSSSEAHVIMDGNDVTPDELGTVKTANHGNHLTIGIDPAPPGIILLKTHFVTYTELMYPDVNYKRDEINCNIPLLDYPNGVTSGSVCHAPSARTIGTEYGSMPNVIEIINRISRIILGIKKDGGKPKIHEGVRGGRFIIKNKRKHYLKRLVQKGGAPMSYKSVSFTDAFIAYVGRLFIDPVFAAGRGLESAIVIFDETSQLGQAANKYLVLLYDFEDDYRHIFYVEARHAMMAFYADTHVGEANIEERNASESLVNIASMAISNLVTVAAG